MYGKRKCISSEVVSIEEMVNIQFFSLQNDEVGEEKSNIKIDIHNKIS